MSTQLISTGIQFPDATTQTTAAAGLGDGQTWQNVKASRAINTTYTNSTGRTIYVVVGVKNNISNPQSWTFTIDGFSISEYMWELTVDRATAIFSFPVPNGSTYRCNGNSYWLELR